MLGEQSGSFGLPRRDTGPSLELPPRDGRSRRAVIKVNHLFFPQNLEGREMRLTHRGVSGQKRQPSNTIPAAMAWNQRGKRQERSELIYWVP